MLYPKLTFIFLTAFSLCVVAFWGSQAAAQNFVSWRKDVKSVGKDQVEMNNGRRFVLERGAVTEFPNLKKSELNIKNVFDFENSLVFHVDIKDGSKLAVTPFSQIPVERIAAVREIGCFIVQRGGDMNSIYGDKEPFDFAKKNCQTQKVQ